MGVAVKVRVGGRVVADAARGASGVMVAALEAGAVALVPEAGEVDARLLPRAAAVEAHRHRAQLDAEDGADALEIVEHELEPVVVDAGLAIPGAGPFLRRVRDRKSTRLNPSH